MQILSPLILKDKQSQNVLTRKVYAPDTYLCPLQIAGNSLFSSVWVQSMDPGTTVTVRYFETTSGNLGEERVDIVSHQAITQADLIPGQGFTEQRTITPFHNKPYAEVIVSGGNAYLGLYVTVIDTFASDIDAALVFDAQLADLTKDKAIPVAGLDINNRFQIIQVVDGALRVKAEIVEGGSASVPLFQSGFVDSVPSGVFKELVSYVVPLTKKLTVKNISVSGDNIATYYVEVDSATVTIKRTYFGSSLNELFDFANSFTLNASQSLTVFVEHSRPWLGNFDAFIVGSISDI